MAQCHQALQPRLARRRTWSGPPWAQGLALFRGFARPFFVFCFHAISRLNISRRTLSKSASQVRGTSEQLGLRSIQLRTAQCQDRCATLPPDGIPLGHIEKKPWTKPRARVEMEAAGCEYIFERSGQNGDHLARRQMLRQRGLPSDAGGWQP